MFDLIKNKFNTAMYIFPSMFAIFSTADYKFCQKPTVINDSINSWMYKDGMIRSL